MKFAAIDARMPIELLVLRMASAVETPEERANLPLTPVGPTHAAPVLLRPQPHGQLIGPL